MQLNLELNSVSLNEFGKPSLKEGFVTVTKLLRGFLHMSSDMSEMDMDFACEGTFKE